MAFEFLSNALDELAEFYNSASGYNPRQKDLLYKRLKYLTESQVNNAFEAIKQSAEKFPTPVFILMNTRSAESEAKEAQRVNLVKKYGRCKWCQSTGMMVVFDHTDLKHPNHEVTMRCGECKTAELTGVLRHIPAWTEDQFSDFEPTIAQFAFNANPTRGRLDEILAMSHEDRAAILRKEPWIKYAVAFYGIDKRKKTDPQFSIPR